MGGAPANYIEDVFSNFLYTGNGSTQTINNGIDLAGKGGLVWIKDRNSGAKGHALFDTVRGGDYKLQSQSTNGQFFASNQVTAFNANGFSLGSAGDPNGSGTTYASWTFRKQPKFFDVVTFTTSGTTNTNQRISHSLGSAPGMIILKATGATSGWPVYHKDLNGGGAGAISAYLLLNDTAASGSYSNVFGTAVPTSTDFGINTNFFGTNTAYVAYLFAHNAGGFGLTGTDNVISCGSYVGAATDVSVSLGYEPQWLMVKNATNASSWLMMDTMRGMPVGADGNTLAANSSAAENGVFGADNILNPTATGFIAKSGKTASNENGSTHIYIAIRRGPMKTPTSGTSVFSPVALASSPNSNVNTGFPPDFIYWNARTSTSLNVKNRVADRLRGFSGGTSNYAPSLFTNQTAAEYSNDSDGDWLIQPFPNNGFRVGGPTPISSSTNIFYAFSRAPSFFDQVCYTGTGAARTINHNLGAVPELMIFKKRSGVSAWPVYAASLTAANTLYLDKTQAYEGAASFWNNTEPTSSVFTVNISAQTNESGSTYVAYLFASCPGVSKVGSYTGTGASDQVINCGFTGGARFVMIKRTDGTSNWRVWDTARGIASGNDPSLDLNNTSAEETGFDQVDPDSSGFKVKANDFWNTSGANFIFLAIA